ncbi:ABC transporter ATP-binding protein [Hondaea fermentalgiana]|uniref:ABC transporter ATP-binding protein n=1 Tax=Hondaea fermentalgiana TaxID=2315210 RepID=A0A2R5GLM9_9STRA|nr:ABC transporter ATP-binding protein [Hondaea fermentalgiana]|eukprot:GBG31806.1 ABC transporter ATP-binding protein [Hondaea fermentalgiana]
MARGTLIAASPEPQKRPQALFWAAAALATVWALRRPTWRAKLADIIMSDPDAGPHGSGPFLVRNKAKLTWSLAATALLLIYKSRLNSKMDADEESWIMGELAKQRDRLEGVLAFADSKLKEVTAKRARRRTRSRGSVSSAASRLKTDSPVAAAVAKATVAAMPATPQDSNSAPAATVSPALTAATAAGNTEGAPRDASNGTFSDTTTTLNESDLVQQPNSLAVGSQTDTDKPNEEEARTNEKETEMDNEESEETKSSDDNDASTSKEDESDAGSDADAAEHEDENVVDVAVIIDATEDVAQFDRNDPLVHQGLLGASRAVCHNILHLGELDDIADPAKSASALTSATASKLIEQLEFEEEILDHADTFRLDKGPYREAMREAVQRAKHVIRLRRKNQIIKTLVLLERAKSQFPYMIVSGLLSVVHGSIYALRTHYMSQVMTLAYEQVGAAGSGPQRIRENIQTLFMLEILGLLSEFVSTKTKSMGRRKFVLKLKTDLFRSLITQDIKYFETHDLYEARQVIGNTDYTCLSLFDLPIDTIQNLSSMSASALMLWHKNRRLSGFMAVMLPLRVIVSELLYKVQYQVESSMLTAQVTNFSDVWTILVNPSGLRTLRSFGREPLETAMFSQGLKVKDRSNDRVTLLYNIFEILRSLVDNSVEIAALWYGGTLASRGELDVSDLASFTSTASYAFERGRSIFYQFRGLFSNNGIVDSAEKMYDLLNNKPGIGIDAPPLASMPTDDNTVSWSVDFEHVTFAYPKRPQVKALADVSFSIGEGEQVGILGESGCGKSTLISLVLRMYDTDAGCIRVGGRPIASWNPLWLRRRIAIVSQDIYLPFRTVKENLTYGLFDAPATDKRRRDEEMRAALRMARCEDLFFDTKRFPQQWHTDIGRDGADLSGGERQRLCIARAILAKPRILILDEATSALDEESQYQVQEAIQALYEQSGRRLTILSVAHRISNFRHVDRLIVLDKGRVVEQGKASDLVKRKDGIFANYVNRATLNFDGEPAEGEPSENLLAAAKQVMENSASDPTPHREDAQMENGKSANTQAEENGKGKSGHTDARENGKIPSGTEAEEHVSSSANAS